MKTGFKKATLAATIAVAMGSVALPAQAANWLMLQGTEPAGSAPRAKVWGFVQAQYQKDFSDANAGNAYIPPKLVGPNLTSQSQFNVNRARIGVRGTGMPLDTSINYFVLAEFGNNAITAARGGSAFVTDASVTINRIPGARVRVGLFKYPGAEEGLQAIHVFDYINFTNVTNQMLLERFPNSTAPSNVPPQKLPVQTSLNAFDKPVGAFRDVGVQVFDSFRNGPWDNSYAVMVGNGNGLNFGDNDNNKDLYLYWSSEKVFGGKGPRREGMKFFIWTQQGKRTFVDSSGVASEHDRDRSGLGFKYLKNPWRFTAEYMKGKGMIFIGPDKPTFDFNGAGAGGNGLDGKADGWYVEGGWSVPGSSWELDARYDVYHRLKDDKFQMDFKTTTLGAQYFFNKKSRITFNYEIRSAEAVNFPSGAGPNANLDGVGNRASVQVTHIF